MNLKHALVHALCKTILNLATLCGGENNSVTDEIGKTPVSF